MPVITLTSDFGTRDPYAAAVKGKILSHFAEVQLVDISHEIQKFDMLEAAHILGSCWKDFPPGTVHLVSVNGSAGEGIPVALNLMGHFFTGIDNGIFSLIFGDEVPGEVVRLEGTGNAAFPARDILAPAAAHLAAGKPLSALGSPLPEIDRKRMMEAFTDADSITGRLVFLDSYENAITNITRSMFDLTGNGRTFSIALKHSRKSGYGPVENVLYRISGSYSDVEEGEVLALFNSNDRLEIAINKGNAGGLLGLRPGDVIKIIFE